MSWRVSIARREAALREFHNSFRWRSLAVARETDKMIAAWRANPPAPPRATPRLNGGDDYTLKHFPGDVFRDGMRSPGE